VAYNPPWVNGGPFAPEELLLHAYTNGAQASATVWKVWGEAAHFGGTPMGFLPVMSSNGITSVNGGGDSDQHNAALFLLRTNNDQTGYYPVALPRARQPARDLMP
jgi:hypothetical protein